MKGVKEDDGVREQCCVIRVLREGGLFAQGAFPVGTRVMIGREPSCHIVLPGRHVSRLHLSLQIFSEELLLQELSSGGTSVNQSWVNKCELNLRGERNTLQVGDYSLALEMKWLPRPSAALRRKAHRQLIESLDLSRRLLQEEVSDSLRQEVKTQLERIVRDLGVVEEFRAQLVLELVDESLGLGPLEGLLTDERISEILVVDPTTIYVERLGRLELSGRSFSDEEAVRSVIERIVTPLGRRVDEASPLVDARLSDGSRVNAVIPPLALKGPCLTIRKFPKSAPSLADLIQSDCLSSDMGQFLASSVRAKKNIVISGGTGSGKTTLLNILSGEISAEERVITIEDAAELQLRQTHVVSLEARPANLEGQGAVSIRDLVKNALRMRPDRIIVGECRGAETLDMLQAMNTGHSGSMTTTHANSPQEAVARLEMLCLLSGSEIPLLAIRHQIAHSVDLIVQQKRFPQGERRITSIAEVRGLSDSGDVLVVEIFRFESDAVSNDVPVEGRFLRTGYLPSFIDQLI